jgi:hypothetical protein
VLAAIHGLDEDFEIGKVSEADHRAMRQSLRAEAVELLRTERAALAAASHPGSAGDSAMRSCPSCDTEAGADARFCSQCGVPLDDKQATSEASRA